MDYGSWWNFHYGALRQLSRKVGMHSLVILRYPPPKDYRNHHLAFRFGYVESPDQIMEQAQVPYPNKCFTMEQQLVPKQFSKHDTIPTYFQEVHIYPPHLIPSKGSGKVWFVSLGSLRTKFSEVWS